jgi:hypothetical protein
MALDIFGNLFGGNTTTGINALLSADQRRLMNQQGNLSAAAALLQAGGRSRQRVGLGQALGAALQAGQQGYQQARTGSLQELLLGEKLQESKTKRERDTQYLRDLNAATQPETAAPTAMPPMPPMPAPQQGVQVFPLDGRPMNEADQPSLAGLLQQQEIDRAAAPSQGLQPLTPAQSTIVRRPAPSKNEERFEELMRKADVANRYNRPDDAEKFLNQAYKIKPVEEFSTTPQFGTSPQGTPISFVLNKSGGMKLLDFQRSPEFNYQDTGAYISVRDKNSNREIERIAKTMSPGEVASNRVAQTTLNLRVKEFNRGAFDRVETPDGFFNVPKGGGVAQPVMGPSGQLRGTGGTPTEGQSNAAGFAQRMELAESIFKRLPAGSQPGVGTRVAEAVPFIGGALARSGQSADTQMYDQAAQDWIRAKLRKESGAAIGVDEAQKEYATYFPMVGDGPEKIQQKAEARRVVTLGMQKSAGKAYQPYVPPAPAPAPAAARPARLVYDPATRVYRYVQE